MKRVFLIVLDSVGIGEMPDAKEFNDQGSNTLYAASCSLEFHMPNMGQLGLFDIDGVQVKSGFKALSGTQRTGSFARMAEASRGKDTTIGHWEIAGIISSTALPVFPNGFPEELLKEFSKRTGRGILCNMPYSGTEVIKDFGEEHLKTGKLIVYTSADSVFQIAAHEDIIPVTRLYQYCEIARELCYGKYGVGRIIARPFEGTYPDFRRTLKRHDYSLNPPGKTMLDLLKESGKSVIAIGKIYDIFAGQGITSTVRTKNNEEGIEKTFAYMQKDFEGICFVNLVDFDMVYGHRNDVEGYAKALSYFDTKLPMLLAGLRKEDILIITADHGCDPSTPSTDHSREYTPMIIYGDRIKRNVNLGTRKTFADIASSIIDYFGIQGKIEGSSFMNRILL